MTQSTGQFDSVSIWGKVKPSPICKNGTPLIAHYHRLKSEGTCRSAYWLCEIVGPEMLKMLAKGSRSNWITGELVRLHHKLIPAQAHGCWTHWSKVRLSAVWTGDAGVKRVLQRNFEAARA